MAEASDPKDAGGNGAGRKPAKGGAKAAAGSAPAAPEAGAAEAAPTVSTQNGGDPQSGAAREAAVRGAEALGIDLGAGLDFVLDVPLRLSVELGGARMRVRDVLQLDKGSVIELDRVAGEPADVLVNGRFVGRGDVVVVDERVAVRLVELAGGARGARAAG